MFKSHPKVSVGSFSPEKMASLHLLCTLQAHRFKSQCALFKMNRLRSTSFIWRIKSYTLQLTEFILSIVWDDCMSFEDGE